MEEERGGLSTRNMILLLALVTVAVWAFSRSLYSTILVMATVLAYWQSIRKGYQKGFVHEVVSIISLFFGLLTFNLIYQLVHGFSDGNVGGMLEAFVLLVVLAIVYNLVRLFLGAVGLVAKLPFVGTVNQILGVVGGIARGFMIMYLVERVLMVLVGVSTTVPAA